jgi:hypothetical protein
MKAIPGITFSISAEQVGEVDRAMQANDGKCYIQVDDRGRAISVSPYHPGNWLCRIVEVSDYGHKWTRTN